MFLKLLLSVFNVQEGQYRLARQKMKKSKQNRGEYNGKEVVKKQQGRKKRCFHQGTLPTEGNNEREARDSILQQDTEQGKRRSKAHLCGKLYEERSCHDWETDRKAAFQYNRT